MSILEDIKQLRTGKRELRKFGLTVGGVFAGIGLIMLLRHKAHWPYFTWPGGALIFLGAFVPWALKHVYIAWMGVAFVLGFIVSHIILGLFFFLIITPVGLIARLTGKDFLSLKLDRQAGSYWISRSQKAQTAEDYERQF